MTTRTSRVLRTIAAASLALSAWMAPSPVYAADDATVEVHRSSVMESYIGDDYGFTRYEVEPGGRDAYDYDLTKKGPSSGTVFNLTDEWDSGIQHILDNARLINADEEFQAYIAQSAIWWYKDPDSISTDFTESGKEAYDGLRNGIAKLVNEARAVAAESPAMDDYYSKKLYSITSSDSEDLHSVKRNSITYFETPTIRIEWDGTLQSDFVSITPAVDGVIAVEEDEFSEGATGRFDVGNTEKTNCFTFRLRIPESLVDAFLQDPTVTFQCDTYANPMRVYQTDDPDVSRIVTQDANTPVSLEFSRSLDTTGWNSREETSPSVIFGIAATGGIVLLLIVIATVSKVSSRRR